MATIHLSPRNVRNPVMRRPARSRPAVRLPKRLGWTIALLISLGMWVLIGFGVSWLIHSL